MKRDVVLVLIVAVAIFFVILSTVPKNIISRSNNTISAEVVSDSNVELKNYIVELKEPSALESLKNTRGSEENLDGEAFVLSNQQKAYLNQEKSKLSSNKQLIKEKIKVYLGKSNIVDFSKTSSGPGALSYSKSSNDLNVLYEYNYALNGLSLKLTNEEAEKLKKMPEVKSVSEDLPFKPDLSESGPLINADDVWIKKDSNGNFLKGKGVKIAVIDTGIEYAHPMFGRCSLAQIRSKGCSKIIGGYDFTDMDDDPLDEDGHGTNVASIIAGLPDRISGTMLTGIAPDAKLLIYRVFAPTDTDESPIGSRVLAALDQAALDGADIIHMSLSFDCVGYYGEYRDDCGPLDDFNQAIDNIVEQGTVVVISAGNCGLEGDADDCYGFSDRNNIGTPGTARKAITVGATTKSDAISTISSRGVVIFDSNRKVTLKPDIVAPGQEILGASKRGIAYAYYTGTSQAAPHVTGVAALLKQKRPTWSPSKIKSVILSTSKELPMPIKDRGYGRVDALAAINFRGSLPTATLKTNKVLTSRNSGNPFNLEGTAKGTTFLQYELYYTKGDLVPSWVRLRTSRKQIDNGILYENFNADLLPGGSKLREGNNYLKLVVKNTDGSQIESISVINVCRKCT